MSTEPRSESRVRRSLEDLRPYDGKWVAVSPDDQRIVAAADSLCELDRLVVAAGEDPQAVGFERVELGATSLGGAQLY